MKNKEKEIEEMSRDLCHSRTCDIKKNGGNCYKYCNACIYAFRAVNAGYREQREGEWVQAKQEVAREIFAEIDLILFEYNIILNGESGLLARFAELKKKYTNQN